VVGVTDGKNEMVAGSAWKRIAPHPFTLLCDDSQARPSCKQVSPSPIRQAPPPRKASMFEFAIFPDDSEGPAAIFIELEDAIAWGVHRYGADRFSIRHCPAVVTETEAGTTGARDLRS
jgi:hypothetical protein